MTEIDFNPEARATEFTVPEGCLLCGGALAVRLTPEAGAQAVCVSCRLISRPRMAFSNGRLALGVRPEGQA